MGDDISLLSDSLANFLLPYLPYLIKGGKEAIIAATKELGKQFGADSWKVSKNIWGKLWPHLRTDKKSIDAIERISHAKNNEKNNNELALVIRELLSQNETLRYEIMAIAKQAKNKGINIFSARESVVVTGESNAPIVTGSNNIVNVYQNTTGQHLTNSSSQPLLGVVDGLNKIHSDLLLSISMLGKGKQDSTFEQKILADGLRVYVDKLQQLVNKKDTQLERDNPYKELLEYDIRDAKLFFGRNIAAHDLLERIEDNPLTILHSESGAGKSSLLKAGVRTALLSKGLIPLYVNLRDYPGQSPTYAIKRTLLPDIEKYPSLAQATLRGFLSDTTELIGRKWLVLILDQFEEFFKLLSDDVQTEFIKELSTCIRDDLLSVRWFISIRGEWLTKIGTFSQHIRNPLANEYFLPILGRYEARQVIIEPAKQRAVAFEDNLVEEILDEIGGDEVYPPKLQLICSELYKSRSTDLINFELYNFLGRAEGILDQYFYRTLNRDLKSNRELAQNILESLITPDQQRDSLTKADIEKELLARAIDTTHLETVLEKLVDSRLLRLREDEEYYELMHDFLVGIIEPDEKTYARKIAKELIAQRVPLYRQFNLMLSREELAFIVPQLRWLNLSDDEKDLVSSSQGESFLGILLNFTKYVFGSAIILIVLGLIVSIFPKTSIPLLWISILVFGIFGLRRGWGKELLTSFGAISGQMLIHVLYKYIPVIRDLPYESPKLFWIRLSIFAFIVLITYQIPPRFTGRIVRSSIRDRYLGGIIGVLNGYLIFGTVLFHFYESYFHLFETAFLTDPAFREIFYRYLQWMPPHMLGEPFIYFLAIILFIIIQIILA